MIRKNWRIILGVAAGMSLGLLYYNYIGCTSGGCPITSNPFMSVGYGAVIGGLFVNIFNKK